MKMSKKHIILFIVFAYFISYVSANIPTKADSLSSAPIQKKLNEIVGQETKKIETDVAEVVEGKVSKEVEEEIKKEFYINNKQVGEDEFKQTVGITTGVKKFTLQQIDEYVELATKNKNANKVMLGKFDEGGTTSYISRAGTDHTYFDMGNKWQEALANVENDLDEMWKINQKFINEQKALGKEFYLSHAPIIIDDGSFYSREIQYLTKPISQGGLGGTIIKQENNLWKIIW